MISEHQNHDLKDLNALYDEHSFELIAHVSVINSLNQCFIYMEKETNRILTTEEEKFEKTKTHIIDQRKKHKCRIVQVPNCLAFHA